MTAALLAWISLAAPVNPSVQTILVLDIEAAEELNQERAELSAALLAELRSRVAVRVVSAGETESIRLELETQGTKTCTSPECQAKLSELATARAALGSSLGRVGEVLVLTLTLVDAKSVTVQGGTTVSAASVAGLTTQLAVALDDVLREERASPGIAIEGSAKTSYAVFDLQGNGISPEAAASLTNVLAVTLKQIDGTTVVSRDDLQAMLQLKIEKTKLGCTDDTACLAEVGGALGVDRMVTGSVGRLGEQLVVTLHLLDVGSTTVIHRVSEAFAGQEDQLLPAIRRAARQLVGVPDNPEPGVLALSASHPEANVFVDEQAVGVLPLPPVGGLGPGRHRLRIAKEGFFDWRTDVFVEGGATTAVWAQLSEVPPKWYQKWWVWTVAGAVVVGATSVALYYGSKSTPDPEGKVTKGTASDLPVVFGVAP